MTYDFKTYLDRSGKDAIAWDAIPIPGATVKEGFTKIPMWVADMNFVGCPTIPEAMIERAKHPLFGYFRPTDEYFNGIINWQETRNGVKGLAKEHIGYENGVLGGVATAMRVLASQGDTVLLHSPTYVGFTGTLNNAGYKIVHSELVQDEQGVWRMDYEDMDAKIKANKIHVAIFCNPHNPSGRAWEREEIEKAMAVYEANGCYVISDEIWSDIILNGNKFTPTQSVNEYARNHTVAMYAPSKTFNLAGLIGSYHIVYNKWLRERMEKEASLSHYNSLNVMSMHALIGAYKPEGHQWVNELCEVLSDNINYAYDFVQKNFKGVKLEKPQATYLLYLDCSEWLKEHNMGIKDLQKLGVSCGVIWQDGEAFHRPNTIRMNLALPHAVIIDAMDRLNKYVFNA